VFYVESLSNPLIEVADLAAVGAFSRRHGLAAVVDNTFATPVLCRPARWGFIVIHSATKYLNGHSDILAGAVAGPKDFIAKVRRTVDLLPQEVNRMAKCWGLWPALEPLQPMSLQK
jgi:cystathionine beta-lyase/cystathionine gamma-synthase